MLVAVAPVARGQGLARRMLDLLADAVRDEVQVTSLRAMVHPDNVASVRAFTAAGYTAVGSEVGFTVYSTAQVAEPPDREMRS